MKHATLILTVLVVLILASTVHAQIWTEDFTGQEGKGMFGSSTLLGGSPGTITNMVGITNWAVSGGGNLNGDSTLNWWRVTNGVFEGQDVGTASADWESKAIDVSAETTVTISMDLFQLGNGCNAAAEYFKILYRLDGGAEQLLTYISLTNQALYDGANYVSDGINVAAASTLNILTRININGVNDGWEFDNVQLAAGAPTNLVPVMGPLSDKAAELSNEVRFAVTASDLTDNDTITLSASNLPAGAVFDTVTNATLASNDFVWASAEPVGVYTTLFWAVDKDGSTGVAVVITVEPPPGEAVVMLNEIYVDPPGSDDNREYLEVRGPASGSLAGLYLLEVEGDSTGPGVIDAVQVLTNLSLGSNGLLILGDNYTVSPPWTIPVETTVADLSGGTMENGTISFLLVTNFSGSVGNDLDTDNDGMFDSTPWDRILDSVGWSDGAVGAQVYSPASLTQSTNLPQAASRHPTNIMERTFEAWYNGDIIDDAEDITYDTNAASANLPAGAYLTPGSANFPSGPPTNQPPVLAAIGSKIVSVNDALQFDVTATDLTDNDDITLWATDLPAGATFPSNTVATAITGAFNWASAGPVGVYTTTFWAADNDGTDSEEITITVNPPTVDYLLISEVADPLDDYNARFVELYNAGSSPIDFGTGTYYLAKQANGGNWYDVRLTGTLAVADVYVVGCVATSFLAQYGFDADQVAASVTDGNGDDAYAVFQHGDALSGSLIDIYGVVDQDGSGEPWEYTDGRAERKLEVTAPNTTWTSNEWTITRPASVGDMTPGTHLAGGNVPVVTITNPADDTAVSEATTTYDVQGTCSTSVVGEFAWTNALTGGNGTVAATTTWTIAGVALDYGGNVITVSGTNNAGSEGGDTVTITRPAPTPQSGMIAFFNEIECNGAGSDSNDMIEIVAPANTNLLGCFIVHYNGDPPDGGIWTFVFTNDFIVPNAGITDTNGWPLGFCVIAQTSGVPDADYEMPGTGLQNGPDGVILYDPYNNILDAVAWGGAGDLPEDDPGTVVTTGDPAAPNFLHLIGTDSGDDRTLQAPDPVRGDDGTGWMQSNETHGAINAGQTSGQIDLTGGGIPAAPVLAVTNPPAESLAVANGYATFDIQGTANTNVVGEILWTNDLTGGAGSVPAGMTWSIAAVPLNVGVNTITVTGTNGLGSAATDSVSIQREAAPTYVGLLQAFINEVEFNSPFAGDSNDYVEIVAPANSNLAGCFLVHYNGSDSSDGGEWRFDFPDFVVPIDGVTDTGGVQLGFCVIAKTNTPVANFDFEMPAAGLQAGPDGLVLYDAASNILDAVAWGGPGDLTIDDPGTVFTIGDTGANNYLHIMGNDTLDDNNTRQAPNNVRGDDGSGWELILETPGAINGGQTSGYMIVTSGGGIPPGDADGDGIPNDWEFRHFGGITNADALTDYDGDTNSTLDEYYADTDPNSGASYYPNVVTNLLGRGVMYLLAGPPTTNSRVYDAFWKTNLVEPGAWTPYGLLVPGDPVGNAVTLTVTNEADGRFYRTGVKVP